MIKRWISIFLVVMLLLAGCAKNPETPPIDPTQTPTTEPTVIPTQTPTTEPTIAPTPTPTAEPTPTPTPSEEPSDSKEDEFPELTELRQSAADSGALLAVAFLGYCELPNFEDVSVYLEANGFTELYPFLGAIGEDRLVRQEGGELYAVVPVSEDVKLTVYEYLMDFEDDYIPDVGQELLTVSDGAPILLIGNVSDIVPNLFIAAEDSNSTLVEYAPCLSMENGQLMQADGIYNFTPSELFGQYEPGYDPLPDAAVCGTWWAQHYTNDELMAINLTLESDGTAKYFYGYPYGDVLESFEGTWNFTDDDRIELNLYGGPVNTEGSSTDGEPYSLQGIFNWSMFSSALILEHTEGSSLLNQTTGEEFRFLPFDGYRFIGDWVAESAYWGWIYELRLFNNGDTWLTIYDEAREYLAGYVGWWSVENDILSLSLILEDGQHPEYPETDYIWGHYNVHLNNPDELVLEFSEGAILTVNMEDNMQETFTRWSTWYEQKYN